MLFPCALPSSLITTHPQKPRIANDCKGEYNSDSFVVIPIYSDFNICIPPPFFSIRKVVYFICEFEIPIGLSFSKNFFIKEFLSFRFCFFSSRFNSI